MQLRQRVCPDHTHWIDSHSFILSDCLGPKLLLVVFRFCYLQMYMVIDQFWYIKIKPKTTGLSKALGNNYRVCGFHSPEPHAKVYNFV